MTAFAHVNTWIFDLDNTLYPASCRLFDQMATRMGQFIEQELGLSTRDANALRRSYYLKHGTTLRGLMLEHGLVPTRFLDFVHDIDYGAVQENQSLRLALSKLPGRKLIFTNGTTAHAERVLHRLGVSGQFDGCYDIVDSDYIPKPDRAPYAKFLRDHGVTPETSAFFEDIPQNLIVPRDMGMTTVLISETAPTDVPAHIDHVTGDLACFLNSV